MNLNVADTAMAIELIAKKFRESAEELEKIAQRMRNKNDLSYAAEALTTSLGAIANCRLELLITRPLHEYELASRDLGKTQTMKKDE